MKTTVRNQPCISCPYKKSTPSGIWEASEYEKLPAYDNVTQMQPFAVFMCHQADGCCCRGWLDVHGQQPSDRALMSLRVARDLDVEAISAALNEGPQVEVHKSGTAAAEFGLRDVDNPSDEAIAFMDKLKSMQERGELK